MLYDLTYIIPAKFTERELPKFPAKVRELVAGVNGTVSAEESLGKRKLAYPIKQVRQGYYFSSVVEAEPEALHRLEKELRMAGDILRFLVTKRRVVSAQQAEKERLLRERVQAVHAARELEAKEAAATKEREKEAKPPAPKMTSEELDKKIEEMLEEKAE